MMTTRSSSAPVPCEAVDGPTEDDSRDAQGGALPPRALHSTAARLRKWESSGAYDLTNVDLILAAPVDLSGLMPFISSTRPCWEDATGKGVCGASALQCATGGHSVLVKERVTNASFNDLVESLKGTPFVLQHVGASLERLVTAVYVEKRATLVVLLNWTGKLFSIVRNPTSMTCAPMCRPERGER
jgi:hypothetical protein